jgi:uncharacterized protein involved in outer membrane biogenesis
VKSRIEDPEIWSYKVLANYREFVARDHRRDAIGAVAGHLEWSKPLTLRRIAIFGFGLACLLTALGGAALISLGHFDLAPAVARRGSRSLDRPVTIASLRVHIGAAVTIELHDLAVDNAPGGSRPRILQLARVNAEISPWALLMWALANRVPEFRHLSIDGVKLLLEHGADERPNWHFGDTTLSPINRRAQFPTLLDARFHDIEIDLRTSSGKTLHLTLEDASIAAPAASQPVTLIATGAYNTNPLQLAGALRSFDALHDATIPFGMDLHIGSGDTTMDVSGTMTDPLNADGADGHVVLKAPNLDRVLAIAGIDDHLELPVTLTGTMTRQGDLWRLTGANGTLGGDPFQGTVQLREGARRAPDDVTLDAGFAVLDLARPPGGGKLGEVSLRIDTEPGILLAAHVSAKQLLYGDLRAADVDLKARIAPGVLVIDPLTLHLAGGAALIDAEVRNSGSSAIARLDAALTGADASQLSALLGLGRIPVIGTVDMRTHSHLTGNTLTEAVHGNRGVVILSMQGGTIERKIIEGASTDLRLLFQAPEGAARIACLFGVLDLRDGIGRVAPLRIRTLDGTINGAGTINLRDDTIDVIVASESASTGFFALDVPLHIAGPILNPRVTPALGGPRGAANAAADPRDIPPVLQEFARRNSCAAGGHQNR